MASNLFVTCSQHVIIQNYAPDGKVVEKFEMPRGFLGAVPDWVVGHWYFKQLLDGGIVTAVVSTSSAEEEQARLEAAIKEQEAKQAHEQESELDRLKEDARKAAVEEAKEKGMDEQTAKKFISSQVGKATRAYNKAQKEQEAKQD